MAEGGALLTPVTEGSQRPAQPGSPRLSLSKAAEEPLPPSDNSADSEDGRDVRILTDKWTHVSPVRTSLQDTIPMVSNLPLGDRPRHSTDLEGQIKLRELELQMQLQMEQLKLQHERELHNSRLAHELALKKLDVSLAELSNRSDTHAPAFRVDTAIKFIPKFTEDDDTFLTSFERIAALHQWPKEQYAAILHAHLSGEALNVLNELSIEDCQDYGKLKAAILTAYAVVPEVHRKTFRGLAKATGETHSEFAFKVATQFRKWTESENAYSDVVALRELIQSEKFLSDLDHELRVWLIDQKPKTLQDAAKLADQYAAVRKGFRRHHDGASPKSWGPRTQQTTQLETTADETTDPESTNNSGSPPTRKTRTFFKDVQCFYCKKHGHTISVCKQRLANAERAAVQDGVPVQLVSLAGPEFTARSVPDTEFKAGTTLSSLDLVPPGYRDHCHEGVLRCPDGTTRPIRLLRDTGALQSLVSSLSVSPVDVEDTGERRQIRSICGEVQSVPLVRVELHSTLCSGTLLCGLIDTLPQGIDVLVGNDLVSPASCSDKGCVGYRSQAAQLAARESEVRIGTTSAKLQEPNRGLESVSEERNLGLESWFDDTFQGLASDMSNLHHEQSLQLQHTDVELKPLVELVRTRRYHDTLADSSSIRVVVPRVLPGHLLFLAHDIPASGPVSEKLGPVDYVTVTPKERKVPRGYPVPLLREYREMDPSRFPQLTPPCPALDTTMHTPVVLGEGTESGSENFGRELSYFDRTTGDTERLLQEFEGVFPDKPRRS